MYPNVTLLIKNNIPTIVYNSKNGEGKELVNEEEDLQEIVLSLAKSLELSNEFTGNSADDFINLLSLAEQGDERLIENLPEINKLSKSFKVKEFLDIELAKAIENKNTFEEYKGEASTEVLKELERNQNIDIFASLLEYIYSILIAKTILYAADLGIGDIHLADEGKLLRLQAKMASELSKIDIELHIVE